VSNSETPLQVKSMGEEKNSGSLPSISGLGTPNAENEDEEVTKGCLNNKSSLVAAVLGIDMKDSACHSYQTWRSLVSRQMDTWSSELLGRYSGSLFGAK